MEGLDISTVAPGGLLGQPDEILLLVAQYLPRRSLNAFCQSSKRVWSCLTPSLYDLAFRDRTRRGESFLKRAATKGQIDGVRMILNHAPSSYLAGDDGYDAFYQAIVERHSKIVQLFLERGLDPNVPQPHRRMDFTPLQYAAQVGHVEIVEMLLDAGAKISGSGRLGKTALVPAIWIQSPAVVRALLSRGIDTSETVHRGSNLLHFAASWGNLDVVKLLLDQKIDPDARDDDGDSPVHKAIPTPKAPNSVRRDCEKIVQLLLEAGTSPIAANRLGDTPLHRAASQGKTETVLRLLNYGADVHAKNTEGETPLHSAAYWGEGKPETIEALLKAGADCSVVDNDQKTPLLNAMRGKIDQDKIQIILQATTVRGMLQHTPAMLLQATICNRQEIVQELLDHGVDVDAAVDVHSGTTALMRAAYSGGIELFKMLLERTKILEATDNKRRTAVSFAAMRGDEECLRLLIEKGAGINHQEADGSTPLMRAVQSWNTRAAFFLLEKGTDADIRDNGGERALFHAVRGGKLGLVRSLLERSSTFDEPSNRRSLLNTMTSTAVFKLLLQHGKDRFREGSLEHALELRIEWNDKAEARALLQTDVNVDHRRSKSGQPILSLAIQKNSKKIVSMLLRAGADIEAADGKQATPLLTAAQFGRDEIARLLIFKGANTQAKDEQGGMALLYAATAGSKALVDLLLQKGADVESTDPRGRTALMLAVGHDQVVELLISRSANVNSMDVDGRTPLSWAVEKGKPESVDMLVKAGAEVIKVDKMGHTPLWWALQSERDEMLKFLVG